MSYRPPRQAEASGTPNRTKNPTTVDIGPSTSLDEVVRPSVMVSNHNKEPGRSPVPDNTSALNTDVFTEFDAPTQFTSNSCGTDLGSIRDEAIFSLNRLDSFGPPLAGSATDLESLCDTASVLGWNDLFDSSFDFDTPFLQDQPYEDPRRLLAHTTNKRIANFLCNTGTALLRRQIDFTMLQTLETHQDC
jgi:hypothetical protein